MVITTLRVLIHAQLETVWNVLLDSMENPQAYQPQVHESRIIEKSVDGLIREMKIDNTIVRERLIPDKKNNTLYNEVLEHPVYTGDITIRLAPTSVQNPMSPLTLEYHLKLEVKPDHQGGAVRPEDLLTGAFNDEMARIKQKAEELED
jgi:hypothetical protein